MSYSQQHRWTLARKAVRRRDKRCVTCGSSVKLEVNHIVPLVGAGYSWSCRHHHAGLETLCHACHVIVTNAQREARRSAVGGSGLPARERTRGPGWVPGLAPA